MMPCHVVICWRVCCMKFDLFDCSCSPVENRQILQAMLAIANIQCCDSNDPKSCHAMLPEWFDNFKTLMPMRHCIACKAMLTVL